MKVSHDEIIATQSVLDGLDAVASEYEKIWGVDRLRLLVSDELRQKFDRQLSKLNAAIALNECEQIQTMAAAMRRGWKALDAEARSLNAKPINPIVWEVPLPSGKVAAFVRTNAEASAVTAQGRYVEVWTLDEVGRLIEGPWKDVGKVKQTFPGALVTDYRNKEPLDDSIPF